MISVWCMRVTVNERIDEGGRFLWGADAVPGACWIDHDIGPLLAEAKTAGFIGHDAAFLVQATLSQRDLDCFKKIE